MTTVVSRLYGIHFTKEFIKTGGIVLMFTIVATVIGSVLGGATRYIAAIALVVVATYYSYIVSRNKLDIDFIQIIKNKIKR
jgi:hypothetical protein